MLPFSSQLAAYFLAMAHHSTALPISCLALGCYGSSLLCPAAALDGAVAQCKGCISVPRNNFSQVGRGACARLPGDAIVVAWQQVWPPKAF